MQSCGITRGEKRKGGKERTGVAGEKRGEKAGVEEQKREIEASQRKKDKKEQRGGSGSEKRKKNITKSRNGSR